MGSFHADLSFPLSTTGVDGAYAFVPETTNELLLSSLLNDSEMRYIADNYCFRQTANNAAPAAVPMTASQSGSSSGGSTLPTTSPSAVAPVPSSLQKRRRKQPDEEGRKKVKRMRKLGACFRCRIYKLEVSKQGLGDRAMRITAWLMSAQCDEDLPCENCRKVKGSQKVFRGPCSRPNLGEVQTFRGGDGDSGVVRAIFPSYKWSRGGQEHEIRLQWPFRPTVGTSPTLVISCQEFQPVRENLEEEYTFDGHVHRVKMPPWACRDINTARSRAREFLKDCQSLLEQEIRETLTDPIMTLTWSEIERYCTARDAPLVRGAMRIYAGAMMNSKYPTSPDRHVFGVAEETHTPYFFEGLPLPPQLTYQVQTMIGYEQMAAQKFVLNGLKKLILHQHGKSNDRLASWYEVYLTMFLLLASVELVYQVQIRFLTAKQGVSERNLTNVSFVTQNMLEEWEASVFNLANHFRYAMNGAVPFTQSWVDGAEMARNAGLDREAVEYIRHIQLQVSKRSEELRAFRCLAGRERFCKPLAAICELFLPAESE